jgi:hypothetical protein
MCVERAAGDAEASFSNPTPEFADTLRRKAEHVYVAVGGRPPDQRHRSVVTLCRHPERLLCECVQCLDDDALVLRTKKALFVRQKVFEREHHGPDPGCVDEEFWSTSS